MRETTTQRRQLQSSLPSELTNNSIAGALEVHSLGIPGHSRHATGGWKNSEKAGNRFHGSHRRSQPFVASSMLASRMSMACSSTSLGIIIDGCNLITLS